MGPANDAVLVGVEITDLLGGDDMGSEQGHTEVPVNCQTISKYSLVGRTVDYDVARKSLLYH